MKAILAALLAAALAGPALSAEGAGRESRESVFAAYKKAVAMAPAIQKLILSDAKLSAKLGDRKDNSDEAARRLIAESPIASAPEIRYLLDHFQHFAVGWDEGMRCVHDERYWLEELERFGPSEEGWKARRDSLRDRAMQPYLPWDEMANGDFERLMAFIGEAARIYTPPAYRKRLAAETERMARELEAAIPVFEKELKTAADSFPAGRSQINEVRKMIRRLRAAVPAEPGAKAP